MDEFRNIEEQVEDLVDGLRVDAGMAKDVFWAHAMLISKQVRAEQMRLPKKLRDEVTPGLPGVAIQRTKESFRMRWYKILRGKQGVQRYAPKEYMSVTKTGHYSISSLLNITPKSQKNLVSLIEIYFRETREELKLITEMKSLL
ncbi:MAG: hypothetical protein GY770_12205, partial [Aestuariibacter sp.]|nr:hypothetical protein [Aestuariibacter sp.]